MSKLRISIDKPCSEKWDSFEKNEDGGFCLSCQKTVVDFTQYSDEELISYFKKHAFSKTCGKMKRSQLKTYTLPKRKRDFSIAAVLTVGLLTIGNPSESKAIHPNYETVVEIKGRVIDEFYKTGIQEAIVMIKGTNISTKTDSTGNFVLNYQIDDKEKVIIEFTFLGYYPTEKEVILSKKIKDLGTVSMSEAVLGNIKTYPWYNPVAWWWGIVNIFRK